MNRKAELVEILDSLPTTLQEIREHWDDIQLLLARATYLARKIAEEKQ